MESKTQRSIDGLNVSTSVIASIFDLTTRRVRQLTEEGIIDKVKSGSYELIPTAKKYISYLKTNAAAKNSDMDAEQILLIERTKHEKTKREIAELELAQMRGTMHNSSDIERVMNDMLAAFRAKILSLPSKVAPLLIAHNDIASIQDIVQEEVYEALSELADYDPILFYSSNHIMIEDDNLEGDAIEDQDS